MTTENKNSSPVSIPERAVHISQVYAWAEQPRRFGGRMTKRTIQWYSSSGLIPSPERIGKEAYYNKYEIYHYLRVIEILNRKFGLLLSQIRTIIRSVKNLAEDETGEITIGFEDDGSEIAISPIEALSDLLEEYLEYERNEESICGSTADGGPAWRSEQIARLNKIEGAIVNRLLGEDKALRLLITGGLIGLEADLFPKGKEPGAECPF